MPAMAQLQPYTSDIVSNQPAGTLKGDLRRQATYFTRSFYGSALTSANWRLGTLVAADDGALYLQNPFSSLETRSWLKLEHAGGDTLVCHTPQAIYDNQGQTLYATRLIAQATATNIKYVPDTLADGTIATDLFFTYRNDTLKALFGDTDPDTNYPHDILALAGDNGGWYGYGEAAMAISPSGQTKTTLPAGITPEDYYMEYIDGEGVVKRVTTQLAISGDTYYIKNPTAYSNDSSQWMKGTLDGSRLTFTKQYLGVDADDNTHLFLLPANTTYDASTGRQTYTAQPSVTLLWNADERIIISDSASCLLINCDDEQPFPLETYSAPYLFPFKEFAATPAQPYFSTFMPYDSHYGYGAFEAVVPSVSEEGDVLNTAKLFYEIYINDEQNPLTFTTDLYQNIPGEMTEVPYDYADNYDFFLMANDVHRVYYYFDPFERLGIQSIYRGNGEEHRSEISWVTYAMANDPSGISSAAAKPVKTEYFDLSGRHANSHAHGILLERTTHSDGSTTVRKIAR